jgi:hypothetical protein
LSPGTPTCPFTLSAPMSSTSFCYDATPNSSHTPSKLRNTNTRVLLN